MSNTLYFNTLSKYCKWISYKYNIFFSELSAYFYMYLYFAFITSLCLVWLIHVTLYGIEFEMYEIYDTAHQKQASHPESSSGGMSLSLAKQSKLLISVGPLTVCWIGAGRVRAINPSQSNPWNHLHYRKVIILHQFQVNFCEASCKIIFVNYLLICNTKLSFQN